MLPQYEVPLSENEVGSKGCLLTSLKFSQMAVESTAFVR